MTNELFMNSSVGEKNDFLTLSLLEFNGVTGIPVLKATVSRVNKVLTMVEISFGPMMLFGFGLFINLKVLQREKLLEHKTKVHGNHII